MSVTREQMLYPPELVAVVAAAVDVLSAPLLYASYHDEDMVLIPKRMAVALTHAVGHLGAHLNIPRDEDLAGNVPNMDVLLSVLMNPDKKDRH